MTDQEFDEKLAEFWAENDLPAGDEAVVMLIRAAARLAERVGMIRKEEQT